MMYYLSEQMNMFPSLIFPEWEYVSQSTLLIILSLKIVLVCFLNAIHGYGFVLRQKNSIYGVFHKSVLFKLCQPSLSKVLARSSQGPSKVLARSSQGPSKVLARSSQGPSKVLARSQQGPNKVPTRSHQGLRREFCCQAPAGAMLKPGFCPSSSRA